MTWLRALLVLVCLALIANSLRISNIVTWLYIFVPSAVVGLVTTRMLVSIPRQRYRSALASLSQRMRYPLSSVAASLWVIALALLPVLELGHFPYPFKHDEFAYLLAADTFAHGRFSNPTPAGWEHFESFHITLQPSYYAKYQPGMGLILALGQVVFGHVYYGVLLALILAACALDWMFHIWLPARWAWRATLLACLPLADLWSGYFVGGPLAVCGGALLLGAYRRIVMRGACWSDGLVMGTAVVLLFWTRPFEGGITAICVALPLLWQLVKTGQFSTLLWPLIPAGLLVLAPCAYFQLRFNEACTGSPWKLPYAEHEQQYALAPIFLFQAPRTDIPIYRHAKIAEFNADMLKWHHEQRSGERAADVIGFRFGVAWQCFFSILWPLVFATLPELWRNRNTRFMLLIWLILLTVIQTVTWFLHHYAAPAFPAWAFVVFMSLRYAALWRPGGRPWGHWLVYWAVGSLVFMVITHRILVGLESPHHWSADKAEMVQEFKTQGGKHLVLVTYGEHHNCDEEWVYNLSDLNQQAVIWARSMDAQHDRELIQAYPARQVWQLHVDNSLPENQHHLQPYSPAALP